MFGAVSFGPSHREPVRFVHELRRLDGGDVLSGWQAGMSGQPCSEDRSRSWWHGWRRGRIDAGFDNPAPDQKALADRLIAAQELEAWLYIQSSVPEGFPAQ
jgi:hypothetical protein